MWSLKADFRGGQLAGASLWFGQVPVAFYVDDAWFTSDSPSWRAARRQVKNASALLNLGMTVVRPRTPINDTAGPPSDGLPGSYRPMASAKLHLN